jgi:hypothetical protein
MRIDMEVVDAALQIATGEMSIQDFAQWVEARSAPSESRSE